MPLFRYQALAIDGKKLKGVIDADSILVAKERLRKQQILITELALLQSEKEELILPLSRLLAITRELSQLLKAKLPLYESLLTIEEKYRRHKTHPLFLDLCDRLKEGYSLSSALNRYPSTFDRIYLSMVQAAEQSGNLATVFEQLYQLLLRQQKLKKQLSAALIYPSFLALFSLSIVAALLFFIIPSLKELFEGRSLHPLTGMILGISNWANDYITFLLSTLLCLIIASVVFVRTAQGKRFISHLLLKLPFLKTLLLHSALVRLCRSLSMLLSSGVPLLEALSLSRHVLKSRLLEEALLRAEKKIVQGERLSISLSDPHIPPLVLRMLALAEETGAMGEAFYNLGEIYEEEVEKHLTHLTTFLQPALLILLGAIVGLVILSILLPLTDVSSFISN